MTRLDQPLYHGTGSYFLQEILVSGLGGRNLPRDWNAAKFLSEVWTECKKSLTSDELETYYCVPRMLTDWDTARSSTRTNWRHGGLYLTTSSRKAREYAQKAGPELAATACELLELLEPLSLSTTGTTLAHYPEIAHWRSADNRPIVFEIRELDTALLRTENGEGPDEALRRLQEAAKHPEYLRYENSAQFEYLGSLRGDCISWEYVD